MITDHQEIQRAPQFHLHAVVGSDRLTLSEAIRILRRQIEIPHAPGIRRVSRVQMRITKINIARIILIYGSGVGSLLPGGGANRDAAEKQSQKLYCESRLLQYRPPSHVKTDYITLEGC